MTFEIAPFRALRFRAAPGTSVDAQTAPPYDIISSDEHRRLLDRSPHGIVRLTLGDTPGERAHYRERAALLEEWVRQGILVEEARPGLYVYGVDYPVPGQPHVRLSFRGLLALGAVRDFSEKIVLPHERTFPDVVDDRYRILEAGRTHLEFILLLYSDRERRIDSILQCAAKEGAETEVTAKPQERHFLWPIRDAAAIRELQELFRRQRPIIADGHHRYTTAGLYRKKSRDDPKLCAGTDWMPMVLGNLFGEGLSILATHRLVSFAGKTAEALKILQSRLEPAREGTDAEFQVETAQATLRLNLPKAVRASRSGVAATDYAILHDVILGDWLKPLLPASGESEASQPIHYFKEGTGEREALRAGKGDILFRMRPVAPDGFLRVVNGGEVFPHKTTFFYPKLWSGMALWRMAEPESSR